MCVLSSKNTVNALYPLRTSLCLEPSAAAISLVVVAKITYERNAITEGVVRAMPSAVQISQRALDLGLLPDSGVDQIIREYVQNQQLL